MATVTVTVGSSATIGASTGGGNIYKNDGGSSKIGDLASLNCGRARLALYPTNDYWSGGAASPNRNDAVVLALLNAGVKPYVHFEWEPSWTPANVSGPQENYTDWFSLGRAFALRFAPNSTFLTNRGLTDIGVTEYAAINEPDRSRGESGTTFAQYHAMLEGLGDGVHSVDPAAKVYPGGYLCANRDRNYTGHGYLSTIADLINDGTLNGFDLHTYVDRSFAPIYNTYDRSHQRDFERCIAQSGITRVDIDWVCTEHNIKADPVATSQNYGGLYAGLNHEQVARNWFLTHFFDIQGAVRSNGTRAPGVRLPWNLWNQSATEFHMASSVSPRVVRWCGHTHKMLLDLLHDMHFTFNDPKGTGIHKLKGGGKSAWVFQNIHSSWSSLYGGSFTINDIPVATTKVDVYDGNGLIQTVNNPSKPTHTFSTPVGKSYLFVANA